MAANSLVGTEIKLNISMEPVDGTIHLSDCEWSAKVRADAPLSKSVTVNKAEATKVDDDTYRIKVDTNDIGAGRYYIILTVDVPDTDFDDNYRREVVRIDTDIRVDFL